jgi:hypothetical protein
LAGVHPKVILLYVFKGRVEVAVFPRGLLYQPPVVVVGLIENTTLSSVVIVGED